jgi:ribosome production factor 2
MQLKSVLVDMFKGVVVDNIALSGLDHVISFTATGGKILMRHYRILLKKSGSRIPLVDLEEMGPRVDWVLRRTHAPAEGLLKEAMRQPKAIKQKKRKNVESNVFGNKIGRIHMQKQDIGRLQTRKVRALKKPKTEDAAEAPKP